MRDMTSSSSHERLQTEKRGLWILVSVAGGIALIVALFVWYFTMVDQAPPPLP